jgi:hypothetical protein
LTGEFAVAACEKQESVAKTWEIHLGEYSKGTSTVDGLFAV